MPSDPLHSLTGVVSVDNWTNIDLDGRLVLMRRVRLPNSTLAAALKQLEGSAHPDHADYKVVQPVAQMPEGPGATLLTIRYEKPKPVAEDAGEGTVAEEAPRPSCCEEAKRRIEWRSPVGPLGESEWFLKDGSNVPLRHCPFCAAKLGRPDSGKEA